VLLLLGHFLAQHRDVPDPRQRSLQRRLRLGIGLGEQAAIHLVAVRHLEKARGHLALRDLPNQRLDVLKHDQVRTQ